MVPIVQRDMLWGLTATTQTESSNTGYGRNNVHDQGKQHGWSVSPVLLGFAHDNVFRVLGTDDSVFDNNLVLLRLIVDHCLILFFVFVLAAPYELNEGLCCVDDGLDVIRPDAKNFFVSDKHGVLIFSRSSEVRYFVQDLNARVFVDNEFGHGRRDIESLHELGDNVRLDLDRDFGVEPTDGLFEPVERLVADGEGTVSAGPWLE